MRIRTCSLRRSRQALFTAPLAHVAFAQCRPAGTYTSSPQNTSGESPLRAVWEKLRSLYREWELSRDRALDAKEDQVTQVGHLSASSAAASSDMGPLSTLSRRDVFPRSALFVPASKMRALLKIATLPADCFVIDLEDSVAASEKRAARANVRAVLDALQEDSQKEVIVNAGETAAAAARPHSRPRVLIRINSPDFDAANAVLDLDLVGGLGDAVEGVVVPKVTARSHDLVKDYIRPTHVLWASFETPQAILQAGEICRQRAYSVAVMGTNDLMARLGLPPDEADVGAPSTIGREDHSLRMLRRMPLLHAYCQVALCARACHMGVLDGVYNKTTDTAGFRREARESRALGFDGKTLVHPSQIALANAAFRPTEAELTWARRVIEASARAHGGVTTVDGRMVEEVHAWQAKQLMEREMLARDADGAHEGHQVAGKPRSASRPSRHKSLSAQA